MMKKLVPAALCAALAVPASALGLSEASDALRVALRRAASINGRAPLLASAPTPAASRRCWERGADAIADALQLPARICVDSVRLEGETLVVAGEPVSGRFPLRWGRATLAHRYESEGGCSGAKSASIEITPDGTVSGSSGDTNDECHSSLDETPLSFRRVP